MITGIFTNIQLDIYQSSSFVHTIEVPENISGYDIQAGFKYSYSDTGIKQFGVTGNSNSITLSLSLAETTGLFVGKFPFELNLISGDNATRYALGTVNIFPSINI